MANMTIGKKKHYVHAITNVGNPVSRIVVDWKPVDGANDTEAATLNAGILTNPGPVVRFTYTDLSHPDIVNLAVGDITYFAGSAS